jgi:hypothetical protein
MQITPFLWGHKHDTAGEEEEEDGLIHDEGAGRGAPRHVADDEGLPLTDFVVLLDDDASWLPSAEPESSPPIAEDDLIHDEGADDEGIPVLFDDDASWFPSAEPTSPPPIAEDNFVHDEGAGRGAPQHIADDQGMPLTDFVVLLDDDASWFPSAEPASPLPIAENELIHDEGADDEVLPVLFDDDASWFPSAEPTSPPPSPESTAPPDDEYEQYAFSWDLGPFLHVDAADDVGGAVQCQSAVTPDPEIRESEEIGLDLMLAFLDDGGLFVVDDSAEPQPLDVPAVPAACALELPASPRGQKRVRDADPDDGQGAGRDAPRQHAATDVEGWLSACVDLALRDLVDHDAASWFPSAEPAAASPSDAFSASPAGEVTALDEEAFLALDDVEAMTVCYDAADASARALCQQSVKVPADPPAATNDSDDELVSPAFHDFSDSPGLYMLHEYCTEIHAYELEVDFLASFDFSESSEPSYGGEHDWIYLPDELRKQLS